MLPNGGSHFVQITQSATFHILEMWLLLQEPSHEVHHPTLASLHML